MILKKELKKIQGLSQNEDVFNEDVSQRGVYWHIDHSLRVINGICEVLKKSDPKNYKWSWNFKRMYILTIKKIPRGVGKAPKEVVTDPQTIKKEDFLEQLKKANQLLKEIEDLPSKSNFKHPYFGWLNLRQTKNFLVIHTRHHLKIMDDIINQ